MRETSGIDIVTCLYDLADLPHLDHFMLSIMGQAGAGRLRLHVMLQRFSFTEVQAVRDAMRGLRRLGDRASVALHNWDYPAPFDLRVPLHNWGLEAAEGRYFICLDVHDQLRPHACAALLARLCSAQAALALGGVAFQLVWWWGDVVLPLPRRADGAAPAPIFMVDRSRVATKDCVFRNSETGSEIGAFVERLSTRYAVDTACQGDILAIRRRPFEAFDLERAVAGWPAGD